MKKALIIVVSFITIFVLSFVNSRVYFLKKNRSINNTSINNSYDISYKTFDETLKSSSVIAEVILLSKEVISENEVFYKVLVKDGFYGVETDSELLVYDAVNNYMDDSGSQYISGKNEYQTGDAYIMVLQKHVSVYYEEDIYTIMSDTYIPVNNDNNITIKHQGNNVDKYEISNVQEFKEHIQDNNVLSVNDNSTVGIDYIRTDNIDTILSESPYIVKVKIESISIETDKDVNRNTYECKVIENYKGTTDSSILAILFKKQVEIGNEYILTLNKENNSSLLHILSAADGIYKVNDSEILKRLH